MCPLFLIYSNTINLPHGVPPLLAQISLLQSITDQLTRFTSGHLALKRVQYHLEMRIGLPEDTSSTSLPAGRIIHLLCADPQGRVVRDLHPAEIPEAFGGVKDGRVPVYDIGLLWAFYAERHARVRFWINIVSGGLPRSGVKKNEDSVRRVGVMDDGFIAAAPIVVIYELP